MTAVMFSNRLDDARARVEVCLEGLLGPNPLAGETARPATLMAAIRHGVLNGGKRFRPFLVIESTRLLKARKTRHSEWPPRSNVSIAIR
nr:hypothetical protein [Marinicella sp. W31]MDC2879503.1 hypothetical protein [Marinicella sp. W31]